LKLLSIIVIWLCVSSANNAARHLSGRRRCRLTCSSTLTPGRILASTAAKGFTRNQTWRNTPTSTQVRNQGFNIQSNKSRYLYIAYIEILLHSTWCQIHFAKRQKMVDQKRKTCCLSTVEWGQGKNG
jgi:hypothetical protein